MTKEELEKEAEKWLRKYLLCCNCEKKCNCIDSNSYCEEQVLKAYVDSAEPREKRIAELEAQIEKLQKDSNEWQETLAKEIELVRKRSETIKQLEAQIEKMNELINRYYEVCTQIPKEYRTMVFDSCLEDTRQLRR